MTSLVRPRFSEFLQEGESVRFSISIGRHEDGYPIYTTAFAGVVVVQVGNGQLIGNERQSTVVG